MQQYGGKNINTAVLQTPPGSIKQSAGAKAPDGKLQLRHNGQGKPAGENEQIIQRASKSYIGHGRTLLSSLFMFFLLNAALSHIVVKIVQGPKKKATRLVSHKKTSIVNEVLWRDRNAVGSGHYLDHLHLGFSSKLTSWRLTPHFLTPESFSTADEIRFTFNQQL